MSAPPGNAGNRLDRCIRDLAALNALPSMCIGRSPDETLEIVLDALPTALSSALVHLTLPGSPAKLHATLDGNPLSSDSLAELGAAVAGDTANSGTIVVPGAGELWYLEAELPIGAERGRLVAARRAPFDPATDRVLVRSAANVVGATLESA